MTPWARLSSALASVPLPGSTPERSTRERLGLHLISMSLQLPHVERVTERLSLEDTTHMKREVDVDLDLDQLAESVSQAVTVRTVQEPHRASLWVPVARHPRASLGPVVLRDGDGAAVPRVSSGETNRLLASGTIRLFTLLAESGTAAARDGWGKDRLARWLVHASLLALVQDGRSDLPPASDTSVGHIRERARDLVRTVLDLRCDDDGHPFLDLVTLLAKNQVVLGELPTDTGRMRVTYRAPELRATPRRAGSWLTERPGEFRFRYDTLIRGGVDSFHVRLDVPEDLEIRRFVVVVEADVRAAEVLGRDITALQSGGPDGITRHPALREHEVRSIRARLIELARRRDEELRQYLGYIRGPAEGRPLEVGLAAIDLDGMAAHLQHLELGLDLRGDNDPSETAGHVQWRRRPGSLEAPQEPSIPARVLVTVDDTKPSQALRILGLLAGNLVLVIALVVTVLWALAHPSPGRGGPADGNEVTVTLLLLVPGVLLSRLVTASRRSVLSSLLVVPQALAYASMATNVALAVLLVSLDATSSDQVDLALAAPVVVLLVLLVLAGVHAVREDRAAREPFPRDAGLPGWLFDGRRDIRRGGRRLRAPTVEFRDDILTVAGGRQDPPR